MSCSGQSNCNRCTGIKCSCKRGTSVTAPYSNISYGSSTFNSGLGCNGMGYSSGLGCNNQRTTCTRMAPPSLSCIPSITSSAKDMESCGAVGGLNHPDFTGCLYINQSTTSTTSDCCDTLYNSGDERTCHPMITSTNDTDPIPVDQQVGGLVVEALSVRSHLTLRGSLASKFQVRQPHILSSTVCTDTLLTKRHFIGKNGCPICVDEVFMDNGCQLTGAIIDSKQINIENGTLLGLRAIHSAPTFRNITNENATIKTKLILFRYRCCNDLCVCSRTYKFSGYYVVIQSHIWSMVPGTHLTAPTSYHGQPNETLFIEPTDCENTVQLTVVDGDIDKIVLVSTAEPGENNKIGTFRVVY